MNVHFATSTKNIDERIDLLKILESAITSSGRNSVRKWIDQAYAMHCAAVLDTEEWKNISAEALDALKKSDAVIIEATVESFSMGFQAALALRMKKPLLILRAVGDGNNDYFDKDGASKVVEQSVLAGDPSGLRTVEVYHTALEAQELINKFLDHNDISNNDLRFNMFLDRESYQYLERVSRETGKTKAKIIRDMLNEQGDAS